MSFNIGAALMAVQLASSGVYICMNGQWESKKKIQQGLLL